MNRWKITTAATMAAAGVVIGTAASAQSPAPKVTTLDKDEFAAEYRCVFPYPTEAWAKGLDDHLTQRRYFKTAVFVGKADQTWTVTRRTNKASAAVITTRGHFRGACRDIVPRGVRVRWS